MKNWKNFINFINLLIGNILLYIANALTCKDKIRLFLSKTLTNNYLSSRSIGISEKDFRRDRREDVQDRGICNRQSEGKVELLYPHRSVSRAIGTWPEL